MDVKISTLLYKRARKTFKLHFGLFFYRFLSLSYTLQLSFPFQYIFISFGHSKKENLHANFKHEIKNFKKTTTDVQHSIFIVFLSSFLSLSLSILFTLFVSHGVSCLRCRCNGRLTRGTADILLQCWQGSQDGQNEGCRVLVQSIFELCLHGDKTLW